MLFFFWLFFCSSLALSLTRPLFSFIHFLYCTLRHIHLCFVTVDLFYFYQGLIFVNF